MERDEASVEFLDRAVRVFKSAKNCYSRKMYDRAAINLREAAVFGMKSLLEKRDRNQPAGDKELLDEFMKTVNESGDFGPELIECLQAIMRSSDSASAVKRSVTDTEAVLFRIRELIY